MQRRRSKHEEVDGCTYSYDGDDNDDNHHRAIAVILEKIVEIIKSIAASLLESVGIRRLSSDSEGIVLAGTVRDVKAKRVINRCTIDTGVVSLSFHGI